VVSKELAASIFRTAGTVIILFKENVFPVAEIYCYKISYSASIRWSSLLFSWGIILNFSY
jgi:hypothetical protein